MLIVLTSEHKILLSQINSITNWDKQTYTNVLAANSVMFHTQGSSCPRRLLDPSTWGRYVVLKRRYLSTKERCVTSQKNEDLIYIAAKPEFTPEVTRKLNMLNTAQLQMEPQYMKQLPKEKCCFGNNLHCNWFCEDGNCPNYNAFGSVILW